SFWLYSAREKVSPLGIEPPTAVTPAVRQIFFEQFWQLRGTRPLLQLGRLHPKKGCDLAIEALAAVAAQASNVSLVLAGPDQIGWQDRLERRVDELGLNSRVVFA